MARPKDISQPSEEESRITHEQPFPDAIAGRLGALLSTYNVAPETITHAILKPHLLPLSQIQATYRDLAGNSKMGELKNSLRAYLQQALCPIGLVAVETTLVVHGKEEIVGYKLTQAGKYFQPLALFSLQEEAQYGSLFPKLSGTAQKSNIHTDSEEDKSRQTEQRTPLTRALLLMQLKQTPTNGSLLTRALHMRHKTVLENLNQLTAIGLVQEEDEVTYTVKGPLTYVPQRIRSQAPSGFNDRSRALFQAFNLAVSSLFDRGEAITIQTIAEGIPEEISTAYGDSFLDNLYQVIDHNKGTGALARVIFDASSPRTKKEFSLTKEGEGFVTRYLEPLTSALQDSAALARIHQQTHHLTTSTATLREAATAAADNYYPFSTKYKKEIAGQRFEQTIAMLEEAAGTGLTARDIQDALGSSRDVPLRHLQNLIETGYVVRVDPESNTGRPEGQPPRYVMKKFLE